VRVSIKSNLYLEKETMDLEQGATLRRLLSELSRNIYFLAPDRLRGWVVVSLNGRELEDLPQGLETVLQEGDRVEIAVAGFGGG